MVPARLALCILLIAAMAKNGQSDDPVYKPCITAETTFINETWYLEAASEGFEMVEHSDCSNCEAKKSWAWMVGAGRSLGAKEKNLCWLMKIKLLGGIGVYRLPFDCKYKPDNIVQQSCSLNFAHTDKNHIPMRGGLVTITHTDNATYAAGTLCVIDANVRDVKKRDRENLWWHMKLATAPEATEQHKAKIRDDFVKMGFKENNTANDDTSMVYVTKMSAHPRNCL